METFFINKKYFITLFILILVIWHAIPFEDKVYGQETAEINYIENAKDGIRYKKQKNIMYSKNISDFSTTIQYNVPLEEIAEKIEYLYACERMLQDAQFYDYKELGPLPEGNVQLSVYTISGNKLLFLPVGMGNKEVLINDELCELYYSEDSKGYVFYYINDFRLNEGGVPVNVTEIGAAEQYISTCIIYYDDTLLKLGDIEVTLGAKEIEFTNICIDGNEYIESLVMSIQNTLAANKRYGNYDIYLETYSRMPSESTEDSYFQATDVKVTGCVEGEDLEQYFYFVIPDDSRHYCEPFISRAYSYCPPGYYGYEETNGRYFVGSYFLSQEEHDDHIQKIKDIGWIKISIMVSEGKEYYEDIYREHISEDETDQAKENIDIEKALDIISYACSYGEWFGMNELGYINGTIRGMGDKDIVVYQNPYEEDILYFIPRYKVNRIVQGDNGTMQFYINSDGLAEFYIICRNTFVKQKGHLMTTLCMTDTWDIEHASRILRNVGVGSLKIADLKLLEVPEVEEDEYVEALENHITELLEQNGGCGEYRIYIGEYEILDNSRACISAAVCGEEEYYVRYMIVKSQKENYYFWSAGFGLNGSLEECSADRHHMNAVCIERTKQLERCKIVCQIQGS